MNYSLINKQVATIIDKDISIIGNLSNISSVLFYSLKDINWVGFYLLKDNVLELGPFQGKVACTKIEIGKGVCGTSVKNDSTIMVDDVHKFAGHIACDSASNSEIVIPIHFKNKIYGVLDIDSTKYSRFTEIDKKGLEDIAKAIESLLKKYE